MNTSACCVGVVMHHRMHLDAPELLLPKHVTEAFRGFLQTPFSFLFFLTLSLVWSLKRYIKRSLGVEF